MARQTLPKTTSQSPNPTDGVAVTWTDADPTNKEQFSLTGTEFVLARNTGAGAATVTITSVADPTYKRTGHITADSIAAGAMHVYGPFGVNGWRQTDNMIYLEASSADIEFAVITRG